MNRALRRESQRERRVFRPRRRIPVGMVLRQLLLMCVLWLRMFLLASEWVSQVFL